MTSQHPHNTVRRWASPAWLCVGCFLLLSSGANSEIKDVFPVAGDTLSLETPSSHDAVRKEFLAGRSAHLPLGTLQRDITDVTNHVDYDVQVRVVRAGSDGARSETAKIKSNSCPEGIQLDDCQTLLAVRDTLVGDGAALNWATRLPIDEWTGVRVSHLTERVLRVRLSHHGLRGTIPAELGSLTELSSLFLMHNDLTGGLPPQLGNLTRLTGLYLGYNRLTGTIPVELGMLSNLQGLTLSANELTGTIPPELGRLVKLNWIFFDRNNLNGPIPATLGSLADLGALWLYGNELNGPIPSALGRLSKLRRLRLENNRLTGAIPRTLANLTNLIELRLADNDLTGCVPASLRNVEENDLHRLDLPDCPPASVIDLTIESSPLDGRAYGAGERIEVSVWFETDVTVSGSPRLALTIGSTVRPARFIANRGNGQVAFRYVVGPADRDSDGISIAPNALSSSDVRIRDNDGEHAILDLGEHAIVNHPSHQVRGALRELVPDQKLEAGGEALSLDLSRYFNVPEGETLTYGTPTSSDPVIATAVIENGSLKIKPLEDGVATITVTATDNNGVTVTLSFRVTVTATMRGLRPWLMGILAERVAREAEAEDNDPL